MNFKHREIKLKRKKNIIEPHTHTQKKLANQLKSWKRNEMIIFVVPSFPRFNCL